MEQNGGYLKKDAEKGELQLVNTEHKYGPK